MSSSLAAAKAQHSVHYVSSWKSAGLSGSIVGDAAIDRGIQRITFRKGPQTGHVTVLVVENTAYVRGDALALQSYMGFSSADASAAAGKWVRVEHTHAWFSTVAAAVRLGSTIDELRLSVEDPLESAGNTTLNGRRVAIIRGRIARSGNGATATLYVQTDGERLPVAEIERQGTKIASTVLSRWNEPVHVSAPPSTLVLR
jgi:hypothetical protein